jgi:hypothetical protein
MVFSLALIPPTSFSASKITPDATCKVYKSRVIYLNKQYTCIKSGKKLVWNKGVLTFPPKTSVSAITQVPENMQGINDQHSLFSGGMDPAFVTLGPKTGSHPELGSYAGKTGVNFEIPLGNQ